MKILNLVILTLALLVPYISAWGSNKDRVRLEDVNAITLTQGKMTTGRRSSPVPQIRCVGGSVGCHAFQPRVVQCINRGSDGYDVQWECKTDMDSAYRFGKIQVSCEGYDYPDDPYILRGSCGLEYELDLTEEGYNKRSQGGGHYRNDYYHHERPRHHYDYGWGGFSFRKLITYVIIGCVIYWALKCCCSGPRHATSYSSSTSSATGTSSYGTGTSGSGSGPGFWTGAATGGMLGYLFGNRGNRGWGYGSSYGYRPYSGGWSSGWGSGSGGWSSRGGGWSSGGGWGGGSSRRSSGSSSRTTSGFGGTSRR